jgi:hypothetical protein
VRLRPKIKRQKVIIKKSKGKRQRAKGKNGGPHGVGRVPDLPSRLRAPAAIARHDNRQLVGDTGQCPTRRIVAARKEINL